MKLKQYVFLLSLLLFCSPFVKAQDFALKSNLLYDATATINIGAEVGLSSRWTLDVSGNFNGWTMSHERRWKHWMLQPEARYWFCQRFGGHFLGMEAHGGQFNVGGLNNSIHFLGTHVSRLSDERFQGWFVGGGVTYGYAWMWGHLSVCRLRQEDGRGSSPQLLWSHKGSAESGLYILKKGGTYEKSYKH